MRKYFFIFSFFLISLGCSLSSQEKSVLESYKGPIIEMYDSKTSLSDSAVLRMKLNAEEYFIYANDGEEYPKGLFMEIYSTKEKKMIATFRSNYVRKDHNEDFFKATGNVILTNLNTNDVLNTEELLWYPNDEKFFTDKFITIKTENELHKGQGLESNQDFSSYKIMKPMGSIQLEEKDN